MDFEKEHLVHKNHLVGCAAGIALALAVVALSGGSAGSLGVVAVVLLCPIAMGVVMWLLMRPTHLDQPAPHWSDRASGLEESNR